MDSGARIRFRIHTAGRAVRMAATRLVRPRAAANSNTSGNDAGETFSAALQMGRRISPPKDEMTLQPMMADEAEACREIATASTVPAMPTAKVNPKVRNCGVVPRDLSNSSRMI